MLLFQINSASHVPAYRQLMDQVKYYIASNALRPGDRLPSIREMARSLALNPTTIVKAYSELEHEGVIELQHGRGVFVRDGGAQGLSVAERAESLRPLIRQVAVEAAQLAAPADLVVRLLQEELDQMDRKEPSDESSGS